MEYKIDLDKLGKQLSGAEIGINNEELNSVLNKDNSYKKFFPELQDKLMNYYSGVSEYELSSGETKSFFDLPPAFSFKSSVETKKAVFCLSYINIIFLICESCEINPEEIITNVACNNPDELYNALRTKLREKRAKIRSAQTEKELVEIIPYIDECMEQVKKMPPQIRTLKLENLKENMCNALSRSIMNLKDMYRMKEMDLSNVLLEYADSEKLSFWLASRILIQAENMMENSNDDISPLLEIIVDYYQYLMHNKNKISKNMKVFINEFEIESGQHLYSHENFIKDYEKFYKKYLFKTDNTNLDLIGKMTKNPPKNLFIDWEIIPEGHLQKRNKQVCKNFLGTRGNLTVRKEELDRKKQVLVDSKINFFNNTPYILQIHGINKMTGYYGFIYKNGTVIFEKYFKDIKEEEPTMNEAIYVMNINNFMELSKYSKTELMEYINNSKNDYVKRVYHTKNWEERVESIINKETSIESKDIKNMFTKLSKNKEKVENLKKLKQSILENKGNTNITEYNDTPKIKNYKFN